MLVMLFRPQMSWISTCPSITSCVKQAFIELSNMSSKDSVEGHTCLWYHCCTSLISVIQGKSNQQSYWDYFMGALLLFVILVPSISLILVNIFLWHFSQNAELFLNESSFEIATYKMLITLFGLQYTCINPCIAEFILGNMKIYLRFVSFLNTEMA